MLKWLILAFVVVPMVEIALLVHFFNLWNALLIIVLTGLVGAFLARQQGMMVWYQLHRDMAAGRPPETALLDGACVLVGAALLCTPGLFTDALGLALLFPPTRRSLRNLAAAYFARRARTRQGVVDVHYTIISDE